MKTLVIVRHAKAQDPGPGQSDLARSLTERGRGDAIAMAKRLRDRVPALEMVVHSPAARAQSTAACFATEYSDTVSTMLELPDLYAAGVREYLGALCRELPDAMQSVAVVAHNPTTHAVAEWLSGEKLDDLPTCSVVRFTVDADVWSHLGPDVCKLCEVDTPKKPA